MSDLPAKPERNRFEPRQPDELVIEAIDERALLEARERMAARARLLWSKRRFLLWAGFCGLVAGLAIALLIPNSYQSAVELMPPDQTSSMGTGGAILSALMGRGSGNSGSGLTGIAENTLGLKTNGNLFLGILQSATVQDDLIHKFGLQRLYHDRYIEDARKDLAKHSDISVDQKSGIISIKVSDHDPKRAAAMAREYVNELNWVMTHLNTSSAYRERVFLDQRLKQVKANLEDAEKQFSQFASQKGAIDIPSQGKAMVVAAATLQGELIAAESELQALRQVYTDDNVRVRSLQAQVNELQSSMEKIAGKGASKDSSARQLYPSLRELPLLGVTYADLLRRTKVEEVVFATLTQEDELAKVQEVKEIPSVKVLDPPLVPDRKSFPPRGLIMALGAMLSFVFGAAWILAGSAWQAVDANDPRKAVAIEVWSDVHASLPWHSRNGSSVREDGAADAK
ncbi:MAG TPA: lipopolysaccharide biosynthesis protein [Patescibacteria group bacterium]|nr:lipopolysaccharide biosynthesis protein [Patescibacteria group bacterium]